MKVRTILAASLTFLVAGALALGADLSGKWSGEVQGRNGQARPVTFNLKADGDKLTGNMVGMQGREVPIADGKIQGDDLSFTVTNEFNGNTVKTMYTGKMSGGEIKMKGQREGSERTQEFSLKRAE